MRADLAPQLRPRLLQPAHPRPGWLILTLKRLLQRLDPTAELTEASLPDLERTLLSLADGPQYFTVRAFLTR